MESKQEVEMKLGALDGLRVLDAGSNFAGPFAGTLAADYGADVIKVEQPRVGDATREWLPKDGISLIWKVLARNKRLITLDLRSDRGRELFLALVAKSDAVIENYRPGTFARWGLSYEDMRAVNPGIILVHVSGYGQTGPYAQRPAYGTVGDAMSGVPAFTGWTDRPPTLPAFPQADMVSGAFALLGLLSAVYERDIRGDGTGQEVDLGLYEPMFRLAESLVIGYDQLGVVKKRMGNIYEEAAPRNAYETSDGKWVVISAGPQRLMQKLADAIDMPDLTSDPRFGSLQARVANSKALDEVISSWIRLRTADEALEVLFASDVVAGLVYSIEDIVADPQFAHRENIISVHDGELGMIRMQGVVPKFSRTPGEVRWAGGTLGENNEDVYCGLLGLDKADLLALETEGVI